MPPMRSQRAAIAARPDATDRDGAILRETHRGSERRPDYSLSDLDSTRY